ncbi:MAG: hypothetical protein HWE18_15420 [Gammaproteobacteria bacterium]|nr:hypothetical protein [Gammaproteobacteria bacterium]
MANPQDEPKPKYMALEGKTQFEMAQAIDNAFIEAERIVDNQDEQVALQWWYGQLEQQVQEEFELSNSQLPSGDVNTQDQFLAMCEQLFNRIYHLENSLHSHQVIPITFKVLLERSLLDAIDMMHAKNIWRFDLQRMMQTLQGRLIHECQFPGAAP